jgi:hypothetical protein
MPPAAVWASSILRTCMSEGLSGVSHHVRFSWKLQTRARIALCRGAHWTGWRSTVSDHAQNWAGRHELPGLAARWRLRSRMRRKPVKSFDCSWQLQATELRIFSRCQFADLPFDPAVGLVTPEKTEDVELPSRLIQVSVQRQRHGVAILSC